MPAVLATGYLIGLVEWACMRMVHPHLNAEERTVGTYVDLSHEAPTLPGTAVHIYAELVAMKGRQLEFDVIVDDRNAIVCRGHHRRNIVNLERFEQRLAALSSHSDG
ncbi:thioesterase family protein [Mycobacterium deserti]|uniref:Thioesterase family protein n=1 Tax=Mycobacterium deserti TaxID=2978347 RepID=A0ABT2MIR7_9MYCO|nr:thioesterase family protein [Mycobacterium deserti]MCT7662122.1 thioesterase family protein [Mycobacterium deserti]